MAEWLQPQFDVQAERQRLDREHDLRNHLLDLVRNGILAGIQFRKGSYAPSEAAMQTVKEVQAKLQERTPKPEPQAGLTPKE